MIAHRPESLALCRTLVRLDEGRLAGADLTLLRRERCPPRTAAGRASRLK